MKYISVFLPIKLYGFLCAYSYLYMQVSAFIKVCQEQISVLKNSINDDEAKSKGWLGIRADHSNADTIAHKHGVV